MAKLTVDGIEVEVPPDFTVLQACEAGGRGDPALLLPRAAVDRRQLPHVPGRGEGPPKPVASCAWRARLPAGPNGESPVITPSRRWCSKAREGRDGVPADQPPARLPDLRPGRRVRPAGPGDGLRRRHQPLSTRTSARSRTSISARWSRPSMTRCIHCTRCVRFATEVAGVAGARRDRPRRGHGDHAPISRRR